jgi:hypothetical protein
MISAKRQLSVGGNKACNLNFWTTTAVELWILPQIHSNLYKPMYRSMTNTSNYTGTSTYDQPPF